MSFQIPNFLKNYLNNTKYRKPFENFVNNSTYYSQLNWQWQSYMQTIVRPCIAYATGSVDGVYNSSLSMSTGMAIVKGATHLAVGDKLFFEGDDLTVRFMSDIWAPNTGFRRFVERAYSFMFGGGTGVIKLNKDALGRSRLDAFRIDRSLITTNDGGEVTEAIFFISLLSNMQNKNELTYWLTEQRRYNEQGRKVISYKVFVKSGIENSPTLPSPYTTGVRFENLPANVQRELIKLGIKELEKETELPINDGLGVWLLSRTATNSCIPDSYFGDPLLYGLLDILWSIDVVYSGTLVDVLNGEGKILVPKQFLQETLSKLRTQYPGAEWNITNAELRGYEDESFVYVMPSMYDKDKMSPTPIQFDIRADQYGKMLEMYERAAAVRAGYAPTSIFPYLTPDNSSKTATEVTAEENLTHATNLAVHNLTLPVFNRALREIARQEGYDPTIELKLSDYVGNKLQFDQNVRENYAAGLIARENAVQSVNNLSQAETLEQIAKILEDQKVKAQQEQERMFGSYGGIDDDNSEQTAEYAGNRPGGSGDENTGDGER